MELQSILKNRCEIEEQIKELLAKYPDCMVMQLVPNIPGINKKVEPAVEIFQIGRDTLLNQLDDYKISVKIEIIKYELAFFAGLWVVKYCGLKIKKLCVAIEDHHPLGMFFDLDVYQKNGKKLNRENVGAKARKCFLCDEPAKVCSLFQKHTYEDLILFIRQTYLKYRYDVKGVVL